MLELLILGYFDYSYYDDLKWDKYWEKHEKIDNLAIVDCSLNGGEDKILSCSVKNKMPNFDFRYVNFRVEMSVDIEYVDYKAYSNDWNISVDSSNNNSMFVSEHADYESRQNGLTVGIEEYITLNFRINDASKGSKIVFKYLNFEDNDSVSHRNKNDIVVNLIDYTNGTSYEGYNSTSPDNKITYSIVNNELNFKYEDYFGKLIKENYSYEELNSDKTINDSIKTYQDNDVIVDKVQNYSCRNSEILSYKIKSEDNVIIQYYFAINTDKNNIDDFIKFSKVKNLSNVSEMIEYGNSYFLINDKIYNIHGEEYYYMDILRSDISDKDEYTFINYNLFVTIEGKLIKQILKNTSQIGPSVSSIDGIINTKKVDSVIKYFKSDALNKIDVIYMMEQKIVTRNINKRL